ncbi:sporulation protein YlmC with PRC-barrel domain [Bradyrhizobium sp. LB1.3]|uniref:PRC-barrel domain-containing protein n=1 Tax=unclassified Bradyrhizobium TaxID=2631580 RepID=UPI003398B9E3
MKTPLCILTAAMLLATPAMAQSPQNNATTAAPNMQSTTGATASMHKDGEWRASKLVGVNVYNDSNEKIGDINDLILDSSGRVANVVIGVGGFLGMGEHNVAVGFDQLKFAKEPVKTASNDGAGKTGSASSMNTTGSASSSANRSDNWYPDHVVLNANKDQLKKMPEFKY